MSNLKEIKAAFSELIDLCVELGDPTLKEAAQGIYRDVEQTDDIDEFIYAADELMIFVRETQTTIEDNSLIFEIENAYNKLLEFGE